MGIKTQTGFTIIETMLFLAVTGLLAAGILAGSGIAIGQQRYRDSVNTLKSNIQQQYSEVTNVVNSRDNTWNCNTNGSVAEANNSAGEARGTSDCVMLGRYVTIDSTGKQLTSSNVVGYRTLGAPTAASDVAEIASYRMSVSPIGQETTEVNWGAQVVKPKTTTPMPLSILIVRSPLSGSVFTFTGEGATSNPNTLVSTDNLKQARDLCVNTDAGTFVGKRMEVRIEPYASNQAAIQIPAESDSICD